MIDLETEFEKHNDDYNKFDRVVNPLYHRPDVSAFLLLDKLVPARPGHDMVVYAGHDEIWLDVDTEELAKVATSEDILTLTRCGVRYDSSNDSLAMFV